MDGRLFGSTGLLALVRGRSGAPSTRNCVKYPLRGAEIEWDDREIYLESLKACGERKRLPLSGVTGRGHFRAAIYHRKMVIFLEHIWNPIRPGGMEMLREAKAKGLEIRDRLGLLDAY